MSATHQRAAMSEQGFTLLELLVVLAIVTLVTVVAVPRMDRTWGGLSVRASAMDLAASLRTTRAAAIKSNRDQMLVVDLAARRYWAEGVLKPRALPRNCALAFAVPERQRTGADQAVVVFRPDGSATGGEIALCSGRRSAKVLVDWLTGSTRIEWGG